MNIAVIGVGYVGLVTGACLAELGQKVICMDRDEEKVDKLNKGMIPIYEPGLEKLVIKNGCLGRLTFTSDMEEAVKTSQVVFIAVNTPTLPDGTSNLGYVFDAAKEIAQHINDYKVIVNKSTVPIGTGRRIHQHIKQVLVEKGMNIDVHVVSNPEFLREGSAVSDCLKPERIIVGAESEKAIRIMKEIYHVQQLFDIPMLITNRETAEMIKYASNSFLATKVSFINEIANLCELCGADVTSVSKAMGLDSRIGSSFLNPGPGYGGSCFPKDTKAFVTFGRALGYIPQIVQSAIRVNDRQNRQMLKKIRKVVGKLENKVITVLGVAFKPETDDIRESPALKIIQALLKSKARIKIYDPQAMENTKAMYKEEEIEYCQDVYDACNQSDCIVLATEWKEFCMLDFKKLRSCIHTPVFIDLRNVYEPDYVRRFGFLYEGVGRK